MDKLLEILDKIIQWFSSRHNRYRMQGARIEVIAIILTRNPTPRILLGKSSYNNTWMPPQEGVQIAETFNQALERCLKTECGIHVPENQTELARIFHVRSIRFAGSVDLPLERQGERLVADDALGTPLEHVRLKRKAYWMATILVSDSNKMRVKPDGNELIELDWFEIDDARQKILETNRGYKADLLLRCLDACTRDLHGATANPV